jgi:hypothetical protein
MGTGFTGGRLAYRESAKRGFERVGKPVDRKFDPQSPLQIKHHASAVENSESPRRKSGFVSGW